MMNVPGKVKTPSTILSGALADFEKATVRLNKAYDEIEALRDKDEQELTKIQARVVESEQAMDRLSRIRDRVVEFFS